MLKCGTQVSSIEKSLEKSVDYRVQSAIISQAQIFPVLASAAYEHVSLRHILLL